MEIDRMIRGDGDGVVHIKMGNKSIPGGIVCGEKNYNKYTYMGYIMSGEYFLASGG